MLNFKINYHGVLGTLLVAFMLGTAFLLNWGVNWWYIGIAIGVYSIAITLILLLLEDPSSAKVSTVLRKILIGCHISFFLLCLGLVIPFHDIPYQWSDGITNIFSADFFRGLYFIVSIAAGIGIPFLPYKKTHGVIGIILIAVMFAEAFILRWNITWWYFICAIGAYLFIVLSLVEQENKKPDSVDFRVWISLHLIFLFLLVGFVLNVNDLFKVAFFAISIFVGFILPFMLLRRV